jgi:tetratricopeptide (TPR) repeat protein
MTIEHPHNNPPVLRYARCAMVLILSSAAVTALYPHFISQIYYVKAGKYHKDGYLGLAVINYKKAASYQPGDAAIWKKMAEAQFEMGRKKTAHQAFPLVKKAKDSYLQATRYNPLDAETAYYLARTESRLERIYGRLHPKKKNNPYTPLPYFEKAIQLRPNGITSHYAMADYLYRHGNMQALIPIVRALAEMYPPVYNHLIKEPLWSPSVKEAVKHGLGDAINNHISMIAAHKSMSSLLAEDKEWPDAILHYQKALELADDKISGKDYIYLGGLYLNNGQIENAKVYFIKGLYVSTPFEKALQTIGHIFKNSNHMDEFFAFYQEVTQRFILSPKMHIISARYLIDLKQYRKAQRILMELNRQTPTAEAYYWLARIAEREKDWDQLELNIQKATVLAPSDMNYRRMFYGVLKRLKKHETVEREIGLMIRNSDSPSPRLYDERAKFRLSRKNYTGAVEDWKLAIGLAPQNAAFHASIAEAYIKLGNLSQALEYYQKAMALNPGNHGYTERYQKLKGKRS